MTDPERHADNRNAIESLLRKIPGFRGYLEKEYRRESDHLARTWLADRLHQAKVGLDNYARSLVDAAKLDDLPHFERLRSRIDGLQSKVRGDVRGYSGFFDYVRVDEQILDDVYDHDMSLMGDVDSLVDSVDGLAGKDKSPVALASDLLSQVEAIEREYAKRSEMLRGLSG